VTGDQLHAVTLQQANQLQTEGHRGMRIEGRSRLDCAR
jgi:hypothetical protein